MHAIIKDGKIMLYDSYIFKESIKEIPGRQWHPEEKAWSVPISRQNIETLDLLGCELSDELANIRQEFASENTTDENTLLPAPLKVSPYQHQLKGYNLACRSMGIIGGNGVSPGFALLMEMGTGKTITSIAIVGKAYLTGKIKHLLILAPKSIVAVWEDEFSKFADFPYSISVLAGTSSKKVEQLKTIPHKGLEVAVVNYDSISLIEKELAAWYPDFLICDESSKIKSPTAKMSKATYRIAKVCKYRLILTGTPIQNNPLDFFSQYKVLDDSIFGKSFYAFKNEYAVLGTYNQPIGWRKLPELVKKAHSIAFRVTKAEALDLPDTIDEIRPVALEGKAQKLYKAFVKESYMELSKGEQGAPVAVTATNILTRLLRLQQITGGFIRSDEESERYEQVSSAKLNALEDVIDTAISENKKLVVIARFIPEIREICRMLDKKKIKYAHICGEVKDKLKELRDKKQHLAEETKKNNAEIEETEYKLSLEMASSETQSFNRSGTLFYLCTKLYASAVKENKAELYEALKNEGYIDGFLNAVSSATGCIHTPFFQLGTDTGRFASRNPNLQNMPRKDNDPIGIRDFLIPNEGHIFIDFDFSQIELRVGSWYCRDTKMLETYRNDGDIHAQTTSVIYNIPFEEAIDKNAPHYKERRSIAKNCNFGVFYGLFSNGLMRNLKKAGIEKTKQECTVIIESLKNGYPKLAEWQKNTKQDASNCGYSETAFGRRRILKGIHSPDMGTRSYWQRCALNTPIQGTAADVLKLAMVRILSKLEEHPYIKPLLTIHDEILFEVPRNKVDEACTIIKECMEQRPFPEFDVPLKAEGAKGHSFGNMEEL